MNRLIRDLAIQRRITRLCHFTPSRNLCHIARDPVGLLATRNLDQDRRRVYSATDSDRINGYLDYVCCSIQYPNAWYFRKARKRDTLFRDWAILLIDPSYLWRTGTRFCQRNAAAAGGSGVSGGFAAFKSLFAEQVRGSQGRVYERHLKPPSVPTDDQAEVLVPDRIQRTHLQAAVVFNPSQAAREQYRLSLAGADLPIAIAPDFFDPGELSRMLKRGRTPVETPYRPGDAHA